jgi:hypothetical protein
MIEKGIVCLAQNNTSTDYVRLAYLQRLSLALVEPDLPYALITDQVSWNATADHMREVFDHVIILDLDDAEDQEWKQRNSWQLARLTPFRETIKVEADLVFTRSISHWWRALRIRDVVISTGCRNYLGDISTVRAYRTTFDLNELPDVYTGLMYWRKSSTAFALFEQARRVYQDWSSVSKNLTACNDPGSNDMVFAVAAKMIGVELVTLPDLTFFQITHMKPAINYRIPRQHWIKELVIELAPPYIRVSAQDQLYPFHYHDKPWVTDSILEKYEHAYRIRKSN